MKQHRIKKMLFFIAMLFSVLASNGQKQWTVMGPSDQSMKELDAFMKTYMEQLDIRSGSLAVARNGKIIYAKGFTNAESGYLITLPTSLFRIASCSKVITSLAIHKLIESKSFGLDSSVQNILQIKDPLTNMAPPASSKPSDLSTDGNYFYAVTVRNLLDHRGGWDRDANGFNDPTFLHDQDVANVYNNGKLPVTKQQLITWGAMQKQQFYPGFDKHYSNFGYLVLGAVIEKKTGLSYINWVKRNLMGPLKIYRPLQSFALESQKQPGEVSYHVIPSSSGNCATGTGTCPLQYGVENNFNFDAFGGWIMSAVDYVKLVGSYTQGISPMPKVAAGDLITWFPNGGVSTKGTVYEHGGLLPGTWSYMAHRADGIDLMIMWNTTNPKANFTYNGSSYPTGNYPVILHQVLDNIKNWPGYDLSPAYFNDNNTSAKPTAFEYDGVWNPASSNYIVERRKTAQDFQALYTKYYGQGYKLISQQCYFSNGFEFHDAIWVPNKEGQFVAWGKTQAEFQKLYDDWWKKGYKLIHQQAYMKNGQLLYDGIWNPNTGGQFVTWEKTRDEFEKLYSEMWGKGFRLIHQQACMKNGQLVYNGIWNPNTGGQFVTWEKTRDDFRKLYDQQWSKGFKLISMQACYKNGQLLYNGIWNPNTGGQYVSWGKTGELMDAENIVQAAAGFQPISLCVYQ